MAQSNSSFSRPVAFITGASSGIGAAASSVFAAAGYDVALAARRRERLEQVAVETRAACPAAQALPVVCDVTSDLSVQEAFRAVEGQFGRLDVLINNAGFGMYGAVAQTPLDSFRANMETNFFGVLRCTQAALPLLRRAVQNQLPLPQPPPAAGRGPGGGPPARGGGEVQNARETENRMAGAAPDSRRVHIRGTKRARRWGASIVMVSSFVGRRGLPLMGAYCASKFALEGLSESLRVELHDEGIAVSVVNPGVTQTGFFKAALGARPAQNISPELGMSPEAVAQVLLQAARRPCRNRYLTWAGKGGMALQWLAPSVLDYLLVHAQRKASDR